VVHRYRYQRDDGSVAKVEPGPQAEEEGGEKDPNIIDPLQGLIDPFFGHGTFIAGLIHQTCPDADILSVKMMGNDGIVDEAALLNGLGFLHQRQVEALKAGADGVGDLVDIVCLSLGYYHESDLDGIAYDSRLKKALDSLADVGIMVVAAAGNNATTRPLLPAAFTSFTAGSFSGDRSRAPLVSVAALNPDGSVALFSNDGDWISCHCPGAALVSTMPRVDVGLRPSVDLGEGPVGDRPVASWRASLDPDRFTGFGTWSGTSFAAPVMAGAAAQAMAEHETFADPKADPVARAYDVLGSLEFPP
jgi:subtilisin family serine protease